VVVEQKFHNTFNELQHKLVLFQWRNILSLLAVEQVVVLATVFLLVAVARVDTELVHFL
jgi:hypothetical protein